MKTLLKDPGTRMTIMVCSLLLLFLVAGSALLTSPFRALSSTKPLRENAPYTPSTWGGYVVRGAIGMPIVTSVYARWIVPSIANAGGGNAEQWIGIGGYGNTNLIQFGTEELKSYDLIRGERSLTIGPG